MSANVNLAQLDQKDLPRIRLIVRLWFSSFQGVLLAHVASGWQRTGHSIPCNLPISGGHNLANVWTMPLFSIFAQYICTTLVISGMNLNFLNVNPLVPRCNIRTWADYPQFHDWSLGLLYGTQPDVIYSVNCWDIGLTGYMYWYSSSSTSQFSQSYPCTFAWKPSPVGTGSLSDSGWSQPDVRSCEAGPGFVQLSGHVPFLALFWHRSCEQSARHRMPIRIPSQIAVVCSFI